MSNVLLKDATFVSPATKPFEIQFSGATDILMPFSGAVVIPKTPGDTPLSDTDFINRFAGVDHHSYLFHSIRYPDKGSSSGEMVFPNLRTADNRPFKVSGQLIFMVDQDYTVVDDLHFDKLFTDISEFYSKRFTEDIRFCAVPKFVLLKINENIVLPQNFAPKSRNIEFSLKTNADDHFESLRSALSPATFSGTIYCFDVAGHLVEGHSALRSLSVNKPITNSPGPKEVLVQFVDIFGEPIELGKFPLDALNISPTPTSTSVDKLYKLTFLGDERKLEVTEKSAPVGTAENQKYKYHFNHVTYYPGFGFSWKPVKQETAGPLKLDLNKKYKNSNGDVPASFLRLCIYHPGDTFQTEAGGGIDESGIFSLPKPGIDSANNFQLFSTKNEVKIFNNGSDFFKDLHTELTKEEERVELKSIFLTNWSSTAHLPILGWQSLYEIKRSDEPTDTFTKALVHINDNALWVSCHKAEENSEGVVEDKSYNLIIPNHLQAVSEIAHPFQTMVTTIPGINESAHKKHLGFIRNNGLYALKIDKDPSGINYEQIAIWKNSTGNVYDTRNPLTVPVLMDREHDFPSGILQLGITLEDPARATLIRTQSYPSSIAAFVNNVGVSLNDTGLVVHVLAISLTGGEHWFIPFNTDPTATDAELIILDRFIAEDQLAVALVNRTVDSNQDFATTLLTNFRLLNYPTGAHISGNIPLHKEEWGGLLRQKIADGVKVKALYWEQFLANMNAGAGLDSGHSNNAEIAAVINRTINTRRGMAVLDRSTRPFGSFHQKATVLIKEITQEITGNKSQRMIAYVGGIDLANGRWDTPFHHTFDPDRPGGAWHDVQAKITGNAAADVLLNFKQRWEGMDVFIQSNDDECKPLNADATIQTDFQADLKIPKEDKRALPESGHFVQVNRTIPPFSCYDKPLFGAKKFVDEAGEAGAFESYKKAIRAARQFILINDQYFFSEELASEIHEVLASEDGPEMAVILLPKDLNESDKIDPLLFLTRKRAIQALYYGTTGGSASGSRCGTFTVNGPGGGTSVKDKVVILHPVNRQGKGTYVHSKHLIVDDIWMTIGSSNMNYRSMWYDIEINVTMVGNKLFRGGTDVVKEHRVNLCSQMLGLPQAYRAMLHDFRATFQLFKAIEKQDATPSMNLHPLEPMVRKLDPNYIKKTDGLDPLFDANVDFLITTDLNSPALTFISCNILDADGRDRIEDSLGVLIGLAGAGKNPVAAYLQLEISFNPSATTLIKNHINANSSNKAFAEVLTTVGDDPTTADGPFRIHHLEIKRNTATDNLVIQGYAGRLSVPISTAVRVMVGVNVINQVDADLMCSGQLIFDPNTSVTTVLPGSFIQNELIVNGGVTL